PLYLVTFTVFFLPHTATPQLSTLSLHDALPIFDRKIDPRGRPRVVREAAAATLVDGGNSMGQIGATFAMRRAIERARTTNVAVAAVRGSNHCGAMAYYARLALAEDMIGLATTNALPTMAPWGAIDKILGINPLAVAIPAAEA